MIALKTDRPKHDILLAPPGLEGGNVPLSQIDGQEASRSDHPELDI